jgi:hypothetical protein
MTGKASGSRLARVGVTLAIGGLLALAAGGFAGATSPYGDQFTGCLKGGVISKVKIGAFPTSPCTRVPPGLRALAVRGSTASTP